MQRRGILYAPDYIVNAGGIINASAEYEVAYNPERASEKTERMYDIITGVIARSKSEEVPTASAADRMAEERVTSVRKSQATVRRYFATESPSNPASRWEASQKGLF